LQEREKRREDEFKFGTCASSLLPSHFRGFLTTPLLKDPFHILYIRSGYFLVLQIKMDFGGDGGGAAFDAGMMAEAAIVTATTDSIGIGSHADHSSEIGPHSVSILDERKGKNEAAAAAVYVPTEAKEDAPAGLEQSHLPELPPICSHHSNRYLRGGQRYNCHPPARCCTSRVRTWEFQAPIISP
jgi:hypothetical protein